MSRHREVDPRHITPLHELKRSRAAHLDELARRMQIDGCVGRPLIVEETSPGRYQAWTGTHRLGAARRVGLRRVPIVLIDKDKWVRRWGRPRGLFVDAVRRDGSDMDKYLMLRDAGDRLAARVMHQEIEMNLGGDAQKCGVDAKPCL